MAPAFPNQQHLFFFVFFLFLAAPIAIKGDGFITQIQCGKNFSSSRSFNAVMLDNVNSVVTELVANTSAHGFASSSHGAGNDTVYGLSECRGDLNGQACAQCIAAAARQIRTSCPHSADSRIWYQFCFLRHDTDNFIGKPEGSKVGVWSSENAPAADKQAAFVKTWDQLLATVGIAAVYGEGRRFAWGKIEDHEAAQREEDGITIYGMVQCTWDLQTGMCTQCLNDAFKIMAGSCGNKVGCFVLTTSCSLRYEVNAFLFFDAPIDPNIHSRSIAIGTL